MILLLAGCGDDAMDPRPDAPEVVDAAVDAPINAPAGPFIELDPYALDFGVVVVGPPTNAMEVTVYNTGGMATESIPIALGGVDADSFAVEETCPDLLIDGGSCSIDVLFGPTSVGPKSATLTVSGQTVALSGMGILGTGPAQLAIVGDGTALTPEHVGTFGTTVATYTVYNVGGEQSGFLSTQLAGANPQDFIVLDPCSLHGLESGERCELEVRFTPRARGRRSAWLEVSAGPGGLVSTELFATGVSNARLTTPFTHRSFGVVRSGATASATLTFTNTGETPTSPIAVTFDAGMGFMSDEGNCAGESIAPGASCTLIAKFTAGAPGAYTGRVAVAALPQGAHEIGVTLTATVTPAGGLAMTPAVGELGRITVGMMGAPLTFTVTNHGTASAGPLAVFTKPAAFALGTNGCAGQTLAAGASCEIVGRYAPTATGPLLGTLGVRTTGGAYAAAGLAGVGLATGTLALSAVTQGFGTVPIDGRGAATVVVTNTGDAPAGATLQLTGSSDFALEHACGNLPPGASCPVLVRYEPSSVGVHTAQLTAGAAATTLTGTGTAAGGLAVSPTQLGFAATTSGERAEAQTVTVRNLGATAISDLVITDTAAFAATSACGASLGPGASCTVSVAFAPTTVGAQTAGLSVTGGGMTASTALGGTGRVRFEIIALDNAPASPPALDFGARTLDAPLPTEVLVTLRNNATREPFLSVVEAYGDPAQFVTRPNSCVSSIGTGTCVVPVRFTPTTAGAKSGSIKFVVTQFVTGAGTRDEITLPLAGTGGP